MTDPTDAFVEVDPANGTVPFADAPMVEPEVFTAPDKLSAVVQAVLASPSGDPKVRGLLAALTSGLGRRLLLNPMLELLPPLDDPDEWDAWLELLVGVALELTSDNVQVDVDQARGQARGVLTALFAGAG